MTDFHVYHLPNTLHVFPQTFVARQCQGPRRILTVEELQIVLDRFQRVTRRFAVLVDSDVVAVPRD